MKDRVPLYPGRVKLTPVAGQSDVYDMTRADQPTQQGDPLNKATLLKDATAALFGLSTDAVPDDVLANLGAFRYGIGNEYVWAKSKLEDVPKFTETKSEKGVLFTAPVTIYYADKFEVVYSDEASEYRFRLVGAESFKFTETNLSSESHRLLGKYVTSFATPINLIYYVPDNAILTTGGNSNEQLDSSPCIMLDDANIMEENVVYGYVNSPNPAAYPPSVPDEYTYTPLGQFGSKVQIATGSYVGTGKYGSSNKNNVYLGFYPKLFIVYNSDNSGFMGVFKCEAMSEIDQGGMFMDVTLMGVNIQDNHARFIPDSGGGIRWWSTNSSSQFNNSGWTYYYFALC